MVSTQTLLGQRTMAKRFKLYFSYQIWNRQKFKGWPLAEACVEINVASTGSASNFSHLHGRCLLQRILKFFMPGSAGWAWLSFGWEVTFPYDKGNEDDDDDDDDDDGTYIIPYRRGRMMSMDLLVTSIITLRICQWMMMPFLLADDLLIFAQGKPSFWKGRKFPPP